MDINEIKQNFETGAKRNAFETVLFGKGRFWHNKNDFFNTGKREINSVMEYLKSINLKLSYGRVLDFGCGVGRLTQALVPYFKEAIGVDISENMIKTAEKHNNHGGKCRYVVNIKENLNIFPDNHFDFIYSNIVLQHMHPRYSCNYIREFIRAVKPGGIVLFQLPSKRIQGINENKFLYLIRSASYKILPDKLIDIYKKRRWDVVCEMYPVKREKVEKLIEESEGELIDVTEDKWAGTRFESLRYCVTK